MEQILCFWENAKDFIGLIGIGAIFAIAYIIINRSRTIFSKMFANNILENELEHKTVSKLLKNYIPHRLKDVNSGRELSYKEFKHAIRHQKYVVIVGSAGIGKSALMTKLAFSYRRIFDKKPSGLEDLSIIYYKIKREMIIDQMVEGISEKLKNHKNSTVFIDGFDELNCLSSDNSYELLEQLLAKLQRKEVNSNCNKLIISMRKEIFENGIETISKQQFGMSDPTIFEILPFSVKQSKSYFKQFFCGAQKRRKYKILKSVLENNPNSIFQYPFVLQFVDVILDEERSQIEIMDLYTALNIIVCKGLQRECAIYNRFIGAHDHKIKAEKYIEAGISFLQYVARVMLESENMDDHITAKEIAEYEKNMQYENIKLSDLLHDKNLSTTRRLLKYNDTQHSYEFIHSMLYEYFIAQAILSGNYIRTEKKKYIDCLSASRTLLPEFCYKAAIERCRSAINIDKTPNTNENDIRKIKSIQYISHNGNITVETVLRAFPYVENINTLDRNLTLNNDEIETLLNSNTLSLTDRNAVDLNCLNCFEYKSIEKIILTNSKTTNISSLLNCTALKELIITLHSIEEFDEWNGLSMHIPIIIKKCFNVSPSLLMKIYHSRITGDTQKPILLLMDVPVPSYVTLNDGLNKMILNIKPEMEIIYLMLSVWSGDISFEECNKNNTNISYNYIAQLLDLIFKKIAYNEDGLPLWVDEIDETSMPIVKLLCSAIKDANFGLLIEKRLDGFLAHKAKVYYWYIYTLWLMKAYDRVIEEVENITSQGQIWDLLRPDLHIQIGFIVAYSFYKRKDYVNTLKNVPIFGNCIWDENNHIKNVLMKVPYDFISAEYRRIMFSVVKECENECEQIMGTLEFHCFLEKHFELNSVRKIIFTDIIYESLK